MTEPKEPKAPRKRYFRDGEKIVRSGSKLLTPTIWAAARAMYEGDIKMTHGKIAEEFGVSKPVVERRSAEEGWQKKPIDSLAEMSELAHRLADRARSNMAEYGPEITADEVREAERKTVVETGADARAEVLARHRKEWAAPRQLSYEAIKGRDFDKAKLAKITSETLQIIQAGERKAWGMDQPQEAGKAAVVVIERS